jgi:hypothetical protein
MTQQGRRAGSCRASHGRRDTTLTGSRSAVEARVAIVAL